MIELCRRLLLLVIISQIVMTSGVHGHGRLYDPPSRSTAWRVGFNTPKDFNDMEGFCGGFERQWIVNGGKCGICGDAFDESVKPHEAPGGVFATGTIVRNYTQGQIISATIQITANHKGFYEFRMCPNNNVNKDPTDECFQRFPSLTFVDNGKTSKFNVDTLKPATYRVRLQLPPEVVCSQCIIQWRYVTGNRWGICPDGVGRVGCGPQEEFRACSDVSISPSGAVFPPTPSPVPTVTPSPVPTVTPSPVPTVTTAISTATMPPLTPGPVTFRPPPTIVVTPAMPTVTIPVTSIIPVAPATIATTSGPVRPSLCSRYTAVGIQATVPGMDNWCQLNCQAGYCPASYCRCMA